MLRLNVINRDVMSTGANGITFNQDNLFYRIDSIVTFA